MNSNSATAFDIIDRLLDTIEGLEEEVDMHESEVGRRAGQYDDLRRGIADVITQLEEVLSFQPGGQSIESGVKGAIDALARLR
jgi:hypothetical protein